MFYSFRPPGPLAAGARVAVETSPGTEVEYDLVCVGSGLGGLTAAITAHDQGLRCLVLEKAPKLGGVCAYSGGEVFVVNNHHMAPADTDAEARAYLGFLAGGYAEPAQHERLYQLGAKVARYVEERAGVRWKVIADFPDYHYPKAPGTRAQGRYLEVELFEGARLGPWQHLTYQTPHAPPGITHDELFGWGGLAKMMAWDFRLMARRIRADLRGMGPGMMAYFVKAALVDRSIPARGGARVESLVQDAGRVVGVRVVQGTDEGASRYTVRARKGVLLAVGGYDWNPQLARSFEGLPDWRSMVQPTVEGDNVVLGGELGAALAGVPAYNLGMFFGYRIPGEEHEGRPLYRASWEGGYPHAIWVNRKGERFADESFYRDYLPRCHEWNGVEQRHPNYPPYLIFDQSYRDRYAFATWMPGMEVPEEVLPRAETPRALAEQLGIDPEGLERTIARFNTFTDTDPDFHRGTYPWAAKMTGDHDRPNPNLGPLDRPPYYGLPLTAVGVGINAVGLRTNVDAQVMHVRGHAIPGLYAAGNSAALLDTGAGYQSGISNLRGMVWGYVAACHAAGVAP